MNGAELLEMSCTRPVAANVGARPMARMRGGRAARLRIFFSNVLYMQSVSQVGEREIPPPPGSGLIPTTWDIHAYAVDGAWDLPPPPGGKLVL